MKNPEVLACCLLLTLAGPALAAPGNVTVHGAVPPITWPESWPGLLTLADLDGDGRVDVIAAHYFAVNIWRQLEGGQLTPLDMIPGVKGGVVTVADLDGDGVPSLLVVDSFGITGLEPVEPFLFGPAQQLASSSMGSAVALAGDLDGDGHPDVLTDEGGLTTWLGDGVGGLKPGLLATTVSSVRTQLGDLDLDGQLDLVAASSEAVPLLGNGDGTFTAQPAIGLPGLASEVSLGDVNADGFLDAAVPTGSGVQLLLGDGSGNFSSSCVTNCLAMGAILGDTDDDGDDDLIASDFAWVRTFLAQSGGLVESGKFLARLPPFEVALGHFDGDAPATILITGDLSNDGDLTLVDCGADGLPAIEQQFAIGSQPLALADVDGDGRDELVVWQSGSGDVAVHEIPGNDTLGPAGPGTPIEALPTAFVLDLDGDSLQDLLLVTGSPPETWHPWRSNGDGTFAPGTTFSGGALWGAEALGDLDGDGDEDVLIESETFEWRANQGDGNFGPALAVSVPGLEVPSIALGDADEDGLPDLFAGSYAPPGLGVREWRGLGGGSFAPPVVLLDSTVTTVGLRVEDLDGDGHVDVLIHGPTPHPSPSTLAQLTVIHGTGGGSFDPASFYPVRGIFAGVAPRTVDFDGDGHRDVLLYDPSSDGPLLLRQAADGSFGASEKLAFAMRLQTVEALATDFDGDGVADLLAGTFGASYYEPSVRVSLVQAHADALDLGHGTLGVGAVGIPVLQGGGSLLPGTKAFVHLQAAPANAPLLLILGTATAYAPVPSVFGTIVPAPQIVLGGLMSDAHGELELAGRWPVDAPAGLAVYAQVWTTDPASDLPLGSNALQFVGS